MMKHPKKIIKQIQEGNLVIFVGAGLSSINGYPNWNALVIEILDFLGDKEPKANKFIQALTDEILEPIEVLHKLRDHRNDVISALYDIIKGYENRDPKSVHAKLAALSTRIVTTNYDSLLERALPNYEKVVYHNDYKISNLNNSNSYIFKIHGDIEQPDKCVLFPTDYENLYSSEISSTFELKKIISDKTILFIGFGMNDPYINDLFEYMSDLYSGFTPEHFIITTERNRSWPKYLTPISLESYDDLESWVDNLLSEINSLKNKEQELKHELSKKTDSEVIKVFNDSDYDPPPRNKFYIGRERELKNISNHNFKAVFITGIGGQGKSALASQYLNEYFDPKEYEFGDWRDFKEEANRFQTKFVSIIKRISPSYDVSEVEQLSNRDLVDTFFQHLGERKIIFVFDNIDNHIDLEKFRPVGDFSYLLNSILKHDHFSKFIFTCRPFIREASVDFYQIRLEGLSKDECYKLFLHYKISVSDQELKKISETAHHITKGHPLWLNLIAGQAIRGVNVVNEFIEKLSNKTDFDEEDFSSILSSKVLDAVWESLNNNQRTLIRGISETVKPETESSLIEVFKSELNSNRFNKALRTLKNLNLIEQLMGGEIELHPLVREYVQSKYARQERSKFITLFVQYYDRFIYVLKPKLSSKLSLKELQNWTTKIELNINQSEYKSALSALEEVNDSILGAGFTEEYLRVAELLFNAVEWDVAINLEYPYFHNQFYVLCSVKTQFGRFQSALKDLDQYSQLIHGKSAHYLSYCSETTYCYWYQKSFDKAIQVGEEGEYLLNTSNLADTFNLRHNLALAWRDSLKENNVEKALDYFLKNESLKDILDYTKIKTELGGSFYGNVGRCLEILKKYREALLCYCISYRLLNKETDRHALLNLGYAANWIGDVLSSIDKQLDAATFYQYAINKWRDTSPPRSIDVQAKMDDLVLNESQKSEINDLAEWKVEKNCEKIIGEILGSEP